MSNLNVQSLFVWIVMMAKFEHNDKNVNNCNQFEICVDGKFMKNNCSLGKIFDEKLNNCVKGSCYKTTYINYDKAKKHEKCVV